MVGKSLIQKAKCQRTAKYVRKKYTSKLIIEGKIGSKRIREINENDSDFAKNEYRQRIRGKQLHKTAALIMIFTFKNGFLAKIEKNWKIKKIKKN